MKVEDREALTLFDPEVLDERRLVPMENNLEGWPLFSRKKSPESGAFEVRQSVAAADGRRLEQLWRVSSSHGFTLPGVFDEDVFVGVMALVRQRGGMAADGRIRFSLYELAKVMGKSKRSGFHKKLKDSLDRIGSTIYYSENAFFVLDDEAWETYRFTVWTVHLSKAKSKDGRGAEHHTLKFDDIVVRSYRSGYLKLLDPELFFRLRLPLAKALYRLIDQKRRGGLEWSVDARELRDLIAMSDSYKGSARIWEVLGPAHKALKRESFLADATLDGDMARYKVHPEYGRDWYRRPAEDAESLPLTLDEQAVAALQEVGVYPKRARSLVDRFGPEKALHVLDVVEMYREDGASIQKPGPYVAKLLESGEPEELAEMARFARSRKPKGSLSVEGTAGERGDAGGKDPANRIGARRERSSEDHTAAAAWGPTMELLRTTTESIPFRTWFASCVPTGLKDRTLELTVPNAFAKDYIGRRFQEEIERALSETLGGPARLTIVSPPE